MKRSLVLYFSSEIFLSLGIGVVNYAQPFLYKSAGLNDGLVGLLFSVNSFFAGGAALFLGPMADKVGASRMFKLATFLMAVAFALLAFFHSFWPWVLTAVVSGIAVGMLMSTENVVLSSLTKGHEKAGVLSKFVSLYMLLISMGVLLSGFLSGTIGFRGAVWVGAGITAVSPLIRFWLKAPDAKSDRLLRLPSKHVALMSVYAVLIGASMGVLNPFITLLLHNHFLLDNHVTSMIQAASTLMVSVGAFLVSSMLRRFRHGRTLLLSFLLAVVFTVSMVFAGGPWLFAGGYLFRTVFLTMPGPIVDAAFLDLSHESEFSQMFGTRVFGNNAGSALGSYGGGAMLNHNLMFGLALASTAMIIFGYIFLLFLLRKFRSTQST
ncbi:MFS transporter [Alicyclobacillus sp. SO9]|uniref:MFS transporter n=1 Tax=Alicyclobacillus sp. SO9 TaxID=2665646 RepID=UPI0018E8680F|nr:MFS transporter [Alicyclobacillus sp. SO9]QQE80186.1 MFS transporter [Alicyclobacillus sp. SO9]